MLDRVEAERIYKIAEDDLQANGQSNPRLIFSIKETLDKIGVDYSYYFYTEGSKFFFNLKRWKRKFLEDR